MDVPAVDVTRGRFTFRDNYADTTVVSKVFALTDIEVVVAGCISGKARPGGPLGALQTGTLQTEHLTSLSFNFACKDINTLP